MTGVSARFFGSAIIYGILGMILGNIMGLTQDHSQLTTHAHLLLIGWVSFAIFGFFYHQFPARAGSLPARLHFWLAQASYIVLIIGLYFIFAGNPEAGDPLAGIGSLAYLLSMLLFAVVALPVVTARR
jgi:hypothetical protein